MGCLLAVFFCFIFSRCVSFGGVLVFYLGVSFESFYLSFCLCFPKVHIYVMAHIESLRGRKLKREEKNFERHNFHG